MYGIYKPTRCNTEEGPEGLHTIPSIDFCILITTLGSALHCTHISYLFHSCFYLAISKGVAGFLMMILVLWQPYTCLASSLYHYTLWRCTRIMHEGMEYIWKGTYFNGTLTFVSFYSLLLLWLARENNMKA